jgi:[phosphatase 2A protein]-leucine-carboxy methyltransferase
MLDETEELELVLAHYAISWGISIPILGDEQIWNDWGLKIKDQSEEVHLF